MGRLRICHLITELGPAGAERVVWELARRLDRRLFETRVIALRGGQVGEWLAEAGVDVNVLGVRGKWDATKLRELVRMLRRDRIDVLHTHLFHADLAGRAAAYLASVPHVVHTVHTAEARFRPWRFAFARLAGGACERIVAVSRSARDHHARRAGLPLSRYTIIPNGVDAGDYARDETARRRLRRHWGAAPQEPVVIFVGRLAEEKGIETLLAAARLLDARGAAPLFVIVGDGPRRRLVDRSIAADALGGRVRVLGFTRDIRGVLSAADIFVMPSRWEGFGLAAAEAMAAGLPVIATRIAGLSDLVVEGRTALMIDVGDGNALAEGIARLCGDAALRRRLGEAGRRRIIQRFAVADMVSAHERLYLETAHQET